MSLRIKLNIILVVVILLSVMITYILVSSTLKREMNGQISAAAHLLLNISDAMDQQIDNTNTIDEIYAQAAQKSVDLTYKTVLIDSKIQNNQANIWQREAIKYLEDNPAELEYSDHKADVKGGFFFVAQTLKNDNKLIGAKFISIYTDSYAQLNDKNLNGVLFYLVLISLIVFVVLNVCFHFVMIKPIQHIVKQSREISKGQSNEEQIIVKSDGELSIIAESFNRMQRSLKAAMLMLNK